MESEDLNTFLKGTDRIYFERVLDLVEKHNLQLILLNPPKANGGGYAPQRLMRYQNWGRRHVQEVPGH